LGSLPPMLSYAQNGEDVVLRRAFAGQESGFYIDIGACHPTADNVTLHFYERGWHGVNVEPDRELHTALVQARPRDVNLCAAVGLERGRADFHPTGTRGHGTLDRELALGRSAGRAAERVPEMPLSDIIACYGPDNDQIDFLKVDVEGWEAGVLASADWSRHRPRVILVEAVDETGAPTHEAWEPGLLAAGYRFALFDGLNRFYCSETEAERLLPRLAAPANVLDNWMRADQAQLREDITRQMATGAAVEQRLAEQAHLHLEALAAAEQRVAEQAHLHLEALAAARNQAEAAEARSHALGIDLEEARVAVADLGRRYQDLSADLERVHQELSAEQEQLRQALQTERQLVEDTKQQRDVLAVETTRAHDAAAAALRREETVEASLAALEMDAMRANAALAEARHSLADTRRLHEEQLSLFHRDHAELQARLNQLHGDNATTQAWLAAIHASTSWRLTAPVRRLSGLVSLGRRAG